LRKPGKAPEHIPTVDAISSMGLKRRKFSDNFCAKVVHEALLRGWTCLDAPTRSWSAIKSQPSQKYAPLMGSARLVEPHQARHEYVAALRGADNRR
jgi:hypothetical protein